MMVDGWPTMAESGIETSVNGAPTMQFTFVQRGKSCL